MLSRQVSLSGGKPGSFGVSGSDDDGKLGVVNPPSFPINPWLRCSKPGIMLPAPGMRIACTPHGPG